MKIVFSGLLMLMIFFISCNNDKKPAGSTDKEKEVVLEPVKNLRAHECTAACNNGFHVYSHNETFHTCSSACGKPHVCKDQCNAPTHVYAHGEAGHYCICPRI